MYLRMFHEIRMVIFLLGKRTFGVFSYIYDYKIILISLLYVFASSILISLLRNIRPLNSIGLLFGLILPVVIILALFFYRKFRVEILKSQSKAESKPNVSFKYCVLLIYLLLVMIIGVCRTLPVILHENHMEEYLQSFTNGSTYFSGYIAQEVEEKHTGLQIKVQPLEDIKVGSHILDKKDTIVLIKLPNYHKLSIGQVCNYNGILAEPKNLEHFNYKEYLKNQNIFLVMENPKVTCKSIQENRKGSILRNSLVDLKLRLIGYIDEVLNEPQSSLLAGILFGERRLFSKSFEDSSRVSGVSHVVAASGYNVTILMLTINRLLFFLPKRWKTVISFVVVWLFTILSGLSASIVRASIMSSISIIAILLGRTVTIHISIPITILIFVFLNPLIVFDVGFLLSLSAVLGLVYILPILIRVRKRLIKGVTYIDESILPTMSCTISTLPISILTFKTFSLWSVLANTLILPVIESTMLFGVFAISLKTLLPSFSYLFFTIVNIQLKYFEFLITLIKSLNWGVYNLNDSFSKSLSLVILSFLIFLIIYLYPLKNEGYNYYLRDS